MQQVVTANFLDPQQISRNEQTDWLCSKRNSPRFETEDSQHNPTRLEPLASGD